MAAAVTHAYCADGLIKKLINYDRIYADIKPNDVRNYAQFPDFVVVGNKIGHLNHNYNILEYVEYLIRYILDNKLYVDEKVISYLYGYVSHIVCDQVFHPYINYLADGSDEYGIKSEHFRLESLLDAYFVNEIMGTNIIDFDVIEYAYNGDKISDELKSMIDSSYKDIYNVKNVAFLMNLSNKIKKILEEVRLDSLGKKRLFFDKYDLLYVTRFIGFDDYFQIGNEYNVPWRNLDDENSYYRFDSVNDLYKMYLEKVFEIVSEINRCIYKKGIVSDDFRKLFDDVSLDKGVHLSLVK